MPRLGCRGHGPKALLRILFYLLVIILRLFGTVCFSSLESRRRLLTQQHSDLPECSMAMDMEVQLRSQAGMVTRHQD